MPSADLERRTLQFALNIRMFFRTIPASRSRTSDIDQVLRSSGSIGANYIEAKEGLSKKDFLFRIRICRKEAQETKYWLLLLQLTVPSAYQEKLQRLLNENEELIRIFTAIAKTTEARYGTKIAIRN